MSTFNNFKIELSAEWLVLPGETPGSVSRFVDADLQGMRLRSENVKSRPKNSLSGNFKISGEDYEIIMAKYNDYSSYYADEFYFNYDLYKKGSLMVETGKCKLINNDENFKTAFFEFYDDINTKYQNIYNAWEEKENILAGVAKDGDTIVLTDHKTFSYPGTVTRSANLANQQAMDAHVNSIINESDLWVPYQIDYVLNAGINYTGTVYRVRFIAYGWYAGSVSAANRFPPGGENWIYNTDVVIGANTYPQYLKRVNVGDIQYATHGGTSSAIIQTEGLYNASLTDISRTIEDVIEFLVGECDSSIGFDSSSFASFADFNDGITYSSSKKTFEDLKLIHLSDFKPSFLGVQRTFQAARGLLSLKSALEPFIQWGFEWFLEDILGTYYFRLQYYPDKTLAAGNDPLYNYFNKDRTALGKVYGIQPPAFDKITNNAPSGTFEFVSTRLSFNYRFGETAISFGTNNILTDINDIISGGNKYDDTEDDAWVLCATTFISGTTYNIRRPTSFYQPDIAVNNTELSFLWLCANVLTYPGKDVVSISGLIDDSRVHKRKIIEVEIPIDNIFEDFDFFGYIEYYNQEAEILSIEQNADENKGILKLAVLDI